MDFKLEVAELLASKINMPVSEISDMIEIPPDFKMGDYAFPTFRLAKEMKRSPNVIAQNISEEIVCNGNVVSCVNNGSYINFFVDKKAMARSVVEAVISQKEKYGTSKDGENKTIVIDYSSPNIAKELHIGHLFTTVIGNAINKIHQAIGYKVVGINYIGDWGTQFGKLIVAYKRWGNKEDVDKYGVKELSNIYVKFHEESENDKAMEEEARSWVVKMQNGDEEALSLWAWFKDISIKEINRIYKRLAITFDSYRGESYYNDKMAAVVEEIDNKNLLIESDGAKIVDLEQFKMPPCLILRRDGGTLYPTRDIASAFDRMELYNFHKALYVTDLRQSMHFAQFFKVIELMGYEWSKDLVHIPYGLLSLEGGNLSSRKGNVVLLDDLFDEAKERILEIIKEKNPELENKEEVADQIGMGAVIFSSLYNSRIKDTTFVWDKILSAEGETGPYIQYTIARTNSLIRKSGLEIENFLDIDYSVLTDDASVAILKLLMTYNDVLVESANKYEPFIVSRYLINLAQSFSKFYHENDILKSEDETKKARLALTLCVNIVLTNGLKLLGISAPKEM